MGGICSKRADVDKSPSDTTLKADGIKDHHDPMEPPASETMVEEFQDHSGAFSFSDPGVPKPKKPQLSRVHSERFSKSKPATKVSEVSSLLGRASTVGFGKAVDVLDTLGSSMTALNLNSGFVSGTAAKGKKISILAFEVANTIVKGANLVQSLSKENINHLKAVVIPSEGVHHLVSKDMDELLKIAANDKREELKIFSGEVVRFGNRCKDPQWHHLDRYFAKVDSEVTPQKHLKEEAAGLVQQMMTLVQNTAELYHELHALYRFEQEYRRKLQEEENSNSAQRGRNREPLEWSSRQKIPVSATRELRHLHEKCRVGCIVQRDMRPNNILTTHDFESLDHKKIKDFLTGSVMAELLIIADTLMQRLRSNDHEQVDMIIPMSGKLFKNSLFPQQSTSEEEGGVIPSKSKEALGSKSPRGK